MLDYHLHLWPHGEPHRDPTLEQLAAYCEKAAAAGVTEIALTEHLFRFAQADSLLRGFWDSDPDPAMRAGMARYWEQHALADLDVYVEAVLAAKAAGLPVVLGLEVDHYRGRMDDVGALVAGYPFDVLLGSVHWIGAWGFDNLDSAPIIEEWDRRATETVWAAYTDAIEELAASATCDVLAHPDLVKVAGRRPASPDDLYDRIAEAVAGAGMAAEVSSAGWRKPAAEAYPAPALLERFHALGVPVTTASDAHEISAVAHRASDLRALLAGAGYEELCAFTGRRPRPVRLAALAAPERR